ncbi:MAG: endolytic transglycosylase MltG [Oleiphilaceae bacterium]|nr:endolytic transglycosylase MltG [Oleiphilaceae bacterium]
MSVLRALLVKLFWLLLMAGALAAYLYHKSLHAPLDLPQDPIVFEVQKGEALNTVLQRLVQEGVLQHGLPAKIHSRLNKIDAQIKAGEFALSEPLSTVDLLALLTSNEQIRYSLTLVEGMRFSEARAVIAQHGKLEQTLGDKSDSEVRALLQAEFLDSYAHPEGLLFPDTYFYRKGDRDLDILQRAHQRLATVLHEEWQQRAEDLPLNNPYEALILASIVEKETGVPYERAEIAGVFVRRLNKGMRLQTDPTVIYGLGDAYNGNITRAHLKQYTAYNTYRINGLPPTPIALAGREAIHAALHPKEGSSLYFVAKGDGSHAFSDTIGQHNKAVREYQLKRRKDYRSTHQPKP